MIDLNKEIGEYRFIDLKKVLKNNSEIPDNFINSIVLYNKALENLKSGSEDIAIIELKKSISINPEFCEAMNLLGLAYCYVNNYSEAIDVFKEAIEIEGNNAKALEYMREISLDTIFSKAKLTKGSKALAKNLVNNGNNRLSPRTIRNILRIGALTGAFLALCFVIYYIIKTLF